MIIAVVFETLRPHPNSFDRTICIQGADAGPASKRNRLPIRRTYRQDAVGLSGMDAGNRLMAVSGSVGMSIYRRSWFASR